MNDQNFYFCYTQLTCFDNNYKIYLKKETIDRFIIIFCKTCTMRFASPFVKYNTVRKILVIHIAFETLEYFDEEKSALSKTDIHARKADRL